MFVRLSHALVAITFNLHTWTINAGPDEVAHKVQHTASICDDPRHLHCSCTGRVVEQFLFLSQARAYFQGIQPRLGIIERLHKPCAWLALLV